MNREIATGGASIYPMMGDVQSTAGSPLITVVGIQGIPVQQVFPTGGEVLTYDAPSNTILLEQPASQVELQTNSVDNSVQNLLNLIEGTGITIAESAGSVTITATGGGGGVTRSALTTNSDGSYWTWSDGIIEAYGVITILANSTNLNGGTITFPTVFTTSVDWIALEVIGLPQSGSFDIATAQVQSMTGSGAVINLQCSVPTGGGGATFNQNVQVSWRALGH